VAVDRGASIPYRNNQAVCSKNGNIITMGFYNPKDTIFTILYGILAMKYLITGRQHLRPAAALAAGLVLFAFSNAPGEHDNIAGVPVQPVGEGAVCIEHSQRDNATQYSISKDGCTITWIARNSEKGVVLHRSQCAEPLALQVNLLGNICRKFFQSPENAKALRTVFWGGLAPDTLHGSRELSLRLALAAHQSPDWDARRGVPRNGDVNGFVKAVANSALIYPELKELFERFHKTIRFSCAEKVLVMEAWKLPFYEQLKQHGIKASERLPYDCMTWFSVTDEPMQ
jgi:hypothetical protein